MNNEMAIESFILYCDDMMIAEESLNPKDFFSNIKKLIEKAWNWFVQKIEILKQKIFNKNKKSYNNTTKEDNKTNDTKAEYDTIKVIDIMNSMIKRFVTIEKAYEEQLNDAITMVKSNEVDPDTYEFVTVGITRLKEFKGLEKDHDELKKYKSSFSNADMIKYSKDFQSKFAKIINDMKTTKESTLNTLSSIGNSTHLSDVQLQRIMSAIKNNYMKIQAIALDILTTIGAMIAA